MRKYRVVVHIVPVDQGPDEHADVQLGMFNAEKIGDLVAKANGMATILAIKETAVEMHNRLAAKEAEAGNADVATN